MKRLTYKLGDRICYYRNNNDDFANDAQDLAERLFGYEELEEQGFLLRLPFEVGSEIYVITKVFSVKENKAAYEIKTFEVNKFVYNSLKNFVIVGVEKRSKGFNERHFFLGDIGRILFLTKEEARQKLVKLQSE